MANEWQSDEEKWRLYKEVCQKYRDGAAASIQEFDRAILTLSAGTLGLSMAFIKDIVPLGQALHLPLLFGSWCCLGAAILLTLSSFVASQKAFRHSEKIAYLYYIEERREAADAKSIAGLFTRYLTYAAGLFFIGALLMTLLFTITNVRNRSAILRTSKSEALTVNDKSVPGTTGNDVQKGVEPAGMIKVPPPPPVLVPPASAPQQTPAPVAPQKK